MGIVLPNISQFNKSFLSVNGYCFIKKKFSILPKCSNSGIGSISSLTVTTFKGCPRLVDCLLDEVVTYSPRGMLIEHGIHKGNLGGTPSRLGLRWAILQTKYDPEIIFFLNKRFNALYLKTPKATSTWEGDVADVGLTVRWDGFVDDQGAVFQFSPTRLFHLPEFLKSFHNIHCKRQFCH